MNAISELGGSLLEYWRHRIFLLTTNHGLGVTAGIFRAKAPTGMVHLADRAAGEYRALSRAATEFMEVK